MAKKSKEKQSHIEKQLEEIETLKETEDLRKRYLTKEDIQKIEAQELKKTKEKLWADKPGEKAEETKEDLDMAREELIKELAKGESVEKEKKQGFAPESLTVEKINEMLEKGLISGENLSEISQMQERIKRNDIPEQNFIDRVQEMIEKNQEKQEELSRQEEAERESKDTEKEEFKRDLLSAIRSPIQDLVLADNRIEKYDKKIKELQKGIIKPMRTSQRRKDIGQLKQISIENKEESLEAIEKIEDEYTLAGFSKGFSAEEIRKIIQDEIREAGGEKQGEAMLEKENFETAEFKDYVDITGQEHSDTTKQEGHVDITGQENFDTTKSVHLDATAQGQPIDAYAMEQEQREQTQHLRRDKIKRGAVKAGKGAKIGATLFGLFWPTVAGAWLKFSSWFTTEVSKGEKSMMPKDIKEKKEKR